MTNIWAVFYGRCVVYGILLFVWFITETSTAKIFKP